MSKETRIANLLNYYAKDDDFAELRGAYTILVGWRGTVDATIVLIGEAPGEEEQKQGIPFVGRSGRLLDRYLDSLHIEDFYITNVVKFRPVGNRDPYYTEIECSIPYLFNELRIVQPRVVVPLGRHALSVFKRNLTISHARGSIFHYKKNDLEFRVIPTWHPSAVLRGDKQKEEEFLKDLTKARYYRWK